MIRVTVGTTVVTWSPEYGFTVAGGEATCEEVASRETANVPVLTQAELERIVAEHQAFPQRHLAAVQQPVESTPWEVPDSGSDEEDVFPQVEPPPERTRPARSKKRGKCGACGHPMHEPDECTMTLNLSGTRVNCDCATAFEVPS